MVDFVPLLLTVIGAVFAVAPEAVAVIHRHQKAAGTTTSPEAVTVTDTWVLVTRLAGVAFVLIGAWFTVQSL